MLTNNKEVECLWFMNVETRGGEDFTLCISQAGDLLSKCILWQTQWHLGYVIDLRGRTYGIFYCLTLVPVRLKEPPEKRT
jgi:hypothetical protein